jgi:hypothetical protein
MNMYTKLSMHLERHMYKRGMYKGDAPADKTRREMSHFRVTKDAEGKMRIRLWNTDIITAHPDGSVLIDTNGYHTHNTTIIRLNDALLAFFDGVRVQIYKQSILSYSQPVLRVNGKLYSYYDGITLNAQGEILTPLHAFEQKRVDRAETKQLALDLKESGFTDAFKLLYAVSTHEDNDDRVPMFGVRLPDALLDNAQADKWRVIISRNKFERQYAYPQYEYVEKSDAKACWATIMAQCKKNMYIVSRSETYVL